MKEDLELWYTEPAKQWIQALPLGNGRLGAMVFGDVNNERIQLNEDTLWTGIPKKKEKNIYLKDLEEVRKLIFNEKYKEAENLANKKLLGPWNESYAPMGNLYLDFFDHNVKYDNYIRKLDLKRGLVEINYKLNDVEYKRTVFISKPDNAIVIKLESNKRGKISFKASLDSLLKFKTISDEENIKSIILKGKAPIHALPSYENSENSVVYDQKLKMGMNFEILLTVDTISGEIDNENGVINVKNADEVVIKLVANTSFNGFKKEAGTEGKDPHELCVKDLRKILNKKYEEIYMSHIEEYEKLFKRVSFNLESDSKYENISTDKRLERVKSGEIDLGLISLYYQYGRYLLIASSREGSQAANLQGIWNEDLRPAWSSNYTTNINVEMNYWPAEVCNLSECHKPLFNLIKEVSEAGKEVASIRYGCRGWVANHNIDLWRQASPAGGSAEWAYWPMAGAWLCTHIFEHYEFTQDKEFLKEMYPIMQGAAEFLLDWLIEDKEGYLITCPSISPENNFVTEDGKKCCISLASTMDMAIIRNLFSNCIKAIDILEDDMEFKNKLQKAQKKLYPYKIGKYGQLEEWFKDFREFEIGHRHISHLFGLYPGNEINEDEEREVFEACKISLNRRLENGGGHTGWSCAWVICLFARLKDSESAYKYVTTLLRKLTFSNLFNVCPPFQIDGNFGGTAAISEMLIQSCYGYIEVLPALPKEWESGFIRGIKARGGFELNIAWEKGKLTELKIKSNINGECKIRYREDMNLDKINIKSNDNNIIAFTVKNNGEYFLI